MIVLAVFLVVCATAHSSPQHRLSHRIKLTKASPLEPAVLATEGSKVLKVACNEYRTLGACTDEAPRCIFTDFECTESDDERIEMVPDADMEYEPTLTVHEWFGLLMVKPVIEWRHDWLITRLREIAWAPERLNTASGPVKEWLQKIQPQIMKKVGHHYPRPVAVFGLGPGGLVAASELARKGIGFFAYEKNSDYERMYAIDLYSAQSNAAATNKFSRDSQSLLDVILRCNHPSLFQAGDVENHLVPINEKSGYKQMLVSNVEKLLAMCLHVLTPKLDRIHYGWETGVVFGDKANFKEFVNKHQHVIIASGSAGLNFAHRICDAEVIRSPVNFQKMAITFTSNTATPRADKFDKFEALEAINGPRGGQSQNSVWAGIYSKFRQGRANPTANYFGSWYKLRGKYYYVVEITMRPGYIFNPSRYGWTRTSDDDHINADGKSLLRNLGIMAASDDRQGRNKILTDPAADLFAVQWWKNVFRYVPAMGFEVEKEEESNDIVRYVYLVGDSAVSVYNQLGFGASFAGYSAFNAVDIIEKAYLGALDSQAQALALYQATVMQTAETLFAFGEGRAPDPKQGGDTDVNLV